MADVLRAPFALEYTYTRSVGPVLGAFFAGLLEQKVLGARTRAGRVLVPPAEYDPETSDAIGPEDLVEVASEGVIVSWTWVPQPRARQPLDRPFAWALIRLDGADSALLHAVEAPGEESISTGQRVRARWAAQRQGFITDIECFEPVPA